MCGFHSVVSARLSALEVGDALRPMVLLVFVFSVGAMMEIVNSSTVCSYQYRPEIAAPRRVLFDMLAILRSIWGAPMHAVRAARHSVQQITTRLILGRRPCRPPMQGVSSSSMNR